MEEPLKVYQLKDIIRQYLEATNKKIIYKSKRKQELIDIINKEKIKIYDYDIPKYDPKPKMPANILKKFDSKPYNDEEQQQLIREMELDKSLPLKPKIFMIKKH